MKSADDGGWLMALVCWCERSDGMLVRTCGAEGGEYDPNSQQPTANSQQPTANSQQNTFLDFTHSRPKNRPAAIGMTFSNKQVEFLARAIVNRLEDRGLVEFADAEAGIDVVVRVLSENFRVAEAIELEARERLKSLDHEPTPQEIDSEVRKLAQEKSFVI